jgi:hypothetical protein
MSYHHFADIDATTKTLASLLNSGGTLIICDNEDGTKGKPELPDELKKAIPHHQGFSEEGIKKLFQDAGLIEFKMEHATSVKYDGLDIDFEIFIAKGIKTASTHM